METAMMQLKDKLLYEIKNLEEDAKTNLHTKGYRDAFVNLVNDIDAQMLVIEKKVLIDFAYLQIAYIDLKENDFIYKKVPEEIYIERYITNNPPNH